MSASYEAGIKRIVERGRSHEMIRRWFQSRLFQNDGRAIVQETLVWRCARAWILGLCQAVHDLVVCVICILLYILTSSGSIFLLPDKLALEEFLTLGRRPVLRTEGFLGQERLKKLVSLLIPEELLRAGNVV